MRFAALLFIFAFPFAGMGQSSGGQTKENVSSWTVDSLKAHYDDTNALRWKRDEDVAALRQTNLDNTVAYLKELAQERDKRYEQRFQAQESASTYTRNIQNEYRGSLNDLASTKVPRTEFEAALKAIAGQIDGVAKASSEKLDTMSKSELTAFTDIQHRLDLKEGSSQGSNSLYGSAITLLIAISAVIGCIFLFVTRRKETRASASK